MMQRTANPTLLNMSSPPGSSSDSSSSSSSSSSTTLTFANSYSHSSPSQGGGKNMANLMANIQVEPLDEIRPLSSKKSPHTSPRKSPRRTTDLPQSSPSKSDLFLEQFQAQVNQMKSAMDAVQNEILRTSSKKSPSHCSSPEKSRSSRSSRSNQPPILMPMAPIPHPPPVPALNPISIGASTTSTPGALPGTSYQAQLSGANGLKLKIKKAGRRGKGAGNNKKRGRKRRKAMDEDEDEFSDDEEVLPPPRKSRANASGNSKAGKSPKSGKVAEPQEEITGSGWGDVLPEKILEKILGYGVKQDGCIPFLVRASKVSRLWFKVASKPELWTNVDLSSGRVKEVYRTERNLIVLIQSKFFKAKHLNLCGWSSALNSSAMEVILDKCKDLESLNLSGCEKLSAANLTSIIHSFTLLKALDLSAISTNYNTKSAVNQHSLQEAAETMGSRLTSLSLANNCIPNCPQLISSLAENCPNLQVLDLSNVTSPRRDSILLQQGIEQLQIGCKRLRVLRLTNTDFSLGEVSIKNQVVAPGFNELEELSVAVDPKKCPGIDDNDLSRFIKNSEKLRLLDVRGCTRVSDSGLVRVPAWDLHYLFVSGCFASKSSDDGLELIVRKWRHSFKEVDFSWILNETAINLAVKALGDEDNEGQTRPLETLDLTGSPVTFESIKVVLEACPGLRRLNLTSCRALPRGIKRNYQGLDQVCSLRDQVSKLEG